MRFAFYLLLIILNIVIFLLVTIWITQFAWFLQNQWSRLFLSRTFRTIKKKIANRQTILISDIPRPFRSYTLLLHLVEEVDKRFTDESWIDSRTCLIREYLKPVAKKLAYSFFWKQRYKATRCYHLHVDPEDAPEMITLMNDKNYYIRMLALRHVSSLGTKEAFLKFIEALSRESLFRLFPYHDVIKKLTTSDMNSIIEIFKDASEAKIIAACIEIFSLNPRLEAVPYVLNAIQIEDEPIKLAIIRYASRQSDSQFIPFLEECLLATVPHIRSKAAKALGIIHSTESIPKLIPILSDLDWEVRLEAAQALKKMGGEGYRVLDAQKYESQPFAYLVSQYVLTLP